MYLFFLHRYVTSKIETNEKVEDKVMMGLKRSFSNHRLMVILNFSWADIRNRKETTMFNKKRNPQFGI